MLYLYEALKEFPEFSRQLICKGKLFTNYDCPQVALKSQIYLEQSCIVYVLSGRRLYHQHNKCWDLRAGNCAFITKGGYLFERPRDEECCVMMFFVPDDFLKQVLAENRAIFTQISNHQATGEPILNLHVSDISKACFVSMLTYFCLEPPPPESLVELKFQELILSLLIDKSNFPLLQYLHHLERQASVSVSQVMLANFCFHFTLSDYARLSCRSVSAFQREFKKQFGESPARWVMKKRLEMAKELITHSDLSIGDICLECGFENNTHFSRVFREYTGMAPREFRKRRSAA